MEFNDVISESDLLIYNNLSQYAIEIGYKKKVAKTKDLIHLFLHPVTKERVLKFSYSKKSGFVVSLKYNKTKEYSKYFHQAIRHTIEESNLRYTGCYSDCKKCDGTKGYTYIYPEGTEYFRCYAELIELPNFTFDNIEETKKLLQNQL